MQCEESVYRVKGATPAVREQGVWCEDKVCSVRNATSAVPGGSHLQYEKVAQCEE